MSALTVVWFRNDLRTLDNAVLCSAIDHAARHNTALVGLFIATPQTWAQHDMAPIKQDFIRRRVQALRTELTALNIPLLAVEGSSYQQVPALFGQLSQVFQVTVFAQTEYELREQQRDAKVAQRLSANKGVLVQFDTQCIMPPGSIRTQQGDIYKVFTPFKRSWLARLHQQGVQCFGRPKRVNQPPLQLPEHSVMQPGDDSSANWPVTEELMLTRLRTFCQQRVADYQQQRDFPAVDGTSKLSPYLAIGAISAMQCVARLQLEAKESWAREKSGAEVWLSELIWREFYKHILVAYPQLIKHQPFQADTAAIRWTNDKTLFQAWCDGQTGYPIVDAAMRQLNQTGWMHNRLRMIVASFLVKDLHIDWRWGERYFMSKLIDGDFAANNGGWQWAASTGTDAAPYFRIFNPVSQSEKFDPQGDFIRLYVPELSKLQGAALHWPAKAGGVKAYPKPIVDHSIARKHTLALFAEVKKS
ncbi:deoxyribodipyrimidine photo-lyase [Rheinheimera nanhaiensis]|uniref:Deoxyribodipyrimidine photo-lyase n=1 Tax=Rheinheimera nanhaiensis E407-8 TaxID=562729 RepID=I1E1M1_9GAMM|nr:deoxyribodipyrimidine photo-lyase [Rheinheimera nanhaiensis]GAB60199.1 deoxyribodipyrimidine photo-lyase [Rheinheimera nanhaiensis E407-8]